MAHVYLALTTGLAGFTKLAVLKVMRAELAQNAEAVRLFLGEARLAARFNHPNVVQTTEVGEDAGCYFISMEYLDGLSLGALLSRTVALQLPLAARLEIACQMLDGLVYLHGLSDMDGSPLGLVHRDISPSNVFVTFEGTVKLLDFGVAKAVGVTEVSEAGSFKGKFGYAAPEQLRGQSDARSDIFTAGLLLWEMLSYQRLSADRTQVDIVRGRAVGADSERMLTQGQGVAPQLLEICVKAAATKPEDRYQSAAALRDALRSYMHEHSLHLSAEQLRFLLADRFDLVRQETRRRIDQRLKEVQLADAAASPSVPPRSEQTPHPVTDSSQHGSLVTALVVTKPRRFVMPASGAAMLLVAAVLGALVARSARSVPTSSLGPPAEAARSRPNVPVLEVAKSDDRSKPGEPPASRIRTTVQAAVEPQVERDDSHESTAIDVVAPLPRPSRAHAPSRRVSRGPKDAVAQIAAAESGQGSPEPPRTSESGVNEPPDFARRRSSKVARPIDTSNPYPN
jgi:serine/threonine-protein kinase